MLIFNLFDKTKILKTDLFSFKNEPLSGLSVFLLIILDLFIFVNIMLGVSGETAKSPSPSVYYPRSCTTHFEGAKTSYNDFGNDFSYGEYTFKKEISPYCSELKVKIDRFTQTSFFRDNRKTIREIDEQHSNNDRRLETIAKQYNTRLFEQIAMMPNNQALLAAKHEYDALQADNAKLDAKRFAIPSVTMLPGYESYKRYVEQNREAFDSAKDSYAFWQPFKEFGRVLVFVMPLLLVFGFFYNRTKRRELHGEYYNPIVKIISTHICVILILPLVWYTLFIIYHIIPKTLLKQLIDFLISIGLLSVLNYLAIAAVVLVFGLLIYFIQKRTIAHKKINSENNIKKIISFSQCPACLYKVDYTRSFCPYCGEMLLEPCAVCGGMTIKALPFCEECGAKR